MWSLVGNTRLWTGIVVFLTIFRQITYSQSHTLLHVPRQFKTIQSAIDKSHIGDTVLIEQGIYFENIRITKNITVASRFLLDRDTSHIFNTIIDGSKAKDNRKASVLTITGKTDTTCVIMGLTIRGGSGTAITVPRYKVYTDQIIIGGGIFILNAGSRIRNNLIVDNILAPKDSRYGSMGAGISAFDTTFGKNIPPYIIIEENSVLRNTVSGLATRTGGIEISQPGIIRNNIVMNNTAMARIKSTAGGIFLSINAEYDVIADGNYICNNSAGIGGGITINDEHSFHGRGIVQNNIIAGNEAFELGGGSYLFNGTAAIFIHNVIADNKARSHGGGILAPALTHLTLVNNIIWNNAFGNNIPQQIRSSEPVRASNNLIQGELIGNNTIDGDPKFIPGDTLFRLSSESPCIGTAAQSLFIAGTPLILPRHDYLGNVRSISGTQHPDIGAIESSHIDKGASQTWHTTWKSRYEDAVYLSVNVRQITPSEYSTDGLQIIRSGVMATKIIVNDTITHEYSGPSTDLTFTFPPDNNFLEVDLSVRGINDTRRLGATIWLDGVDQKFNRLESNLDYFYYSYRNLRPGTYGLMIRPEDESQFIDTINQSSIRIIVLSYWYQRWWAYVLYAVAVFAIAFAVYRTRIRRTLLEQRLRSEKIQKEKLEELSNLKSRFFANITHELRTPLTLILGPVETLLSKKPNKESEEQLSFIQRNAKKLLSSIDLLLQFSHLEAGTIKLVVAEQNVLELIRRITGYFASNAAKKQIKLQFYSALETIYGFVDAEKIDHILQNLLSNAIKFNSAGGTIDVTVWRESEQVCFSVQDSGIGISEENLEHIFERFFRVDTTHKTEGSGIGLSFSKELTEIHHGTMELKSAFGKGTTVTVRIPLSGYSPDEISITPPDNAISTLQSSPSNPTLDDDEYSQATNDLPIILVAEDNDDARHYICSQLSDTYRLIEAIDGEEAINSAQFQIPDLVITDVLMPRKDGYEVCEAIKKDERTCHIPVILLTALAEREDKMTGLEIGADDYLTKPFDAKELTIRVRNLIQSRKKMLEAFTRTTELRPGFVTVPSLDDTFLQKALAVVDKHLSNPEFGVESFAQGMFLSRAQLHRKLKAITNLTATEFIRHLRLQRAKDLLENNAGTIAEIADMVGFTNHSYFAKCFLDQFDLLPNQVRRAQQ